MDDHARCHLQKRQRFAPSGWTRRLAYYLLPYFLLVLGGQLMAEQPAILIRMKGESEKARLIGCTPEGKWDFEQNGKITGLRADDFVRWGHPANRLSGPILYLTDGSCLVADQAFTQLQIKDDEVHFDSRMIGDNRRLPLPHVEGIMLKPVTAARQRDLWMEPFKTGDRERDVVLLRNGDRMEGTVISLDEEALQLLTRTNDTLKIPRDNLKAMLFQSALLDRPEPLERFTLIELSDGSSLRAASSKGDAANIEVQTAGGVNALTFQIPWPRTKSVIPESITGLLPIGYRTVFLSDLEESNYQHQPYLSLEWPFRRDRNVMGERLQTQNKLYEKGIGMHSDAELTFKLRQSFEQFEGSVGIDDSAAGQGSVRFEVDVQRGGAPWQTVFTSRLLRGSDRPESFSINLQGVDAIRLKTDHAIGGAVLDRANWLDARLRRSYD